MTELITTDICVIGAGPAGLSVAAGAAQMGARTVLIEAHRMGGDCLNTGCIPSKSLLSAASAASVGRRAAVFGLEATDPVVDFAAVNRYVHGVIAAIAPHDSVERFTALGCRVIEAEARFVDRRTVVADAFRVRARRFVVATGSRPLVPDIPGLSDVPFFTSDTVFASTVLPHHLIIIGAGPVGCELAQAYSRLGANVTLLDAGRLLARDDPEAVDVVRQSLLAEGIAVKEAVHIARIERSHTGIAAVIREDANERRIEGSHILLAVGRRPYVEQLDLEKAGVRLSSKGVEVDARLRTANRRIYAAGDVVGENLFTHIAGHHATVVLRNVLFRLPTKHVVPAVPWVTYTSPELAQVGPTEAQARASNPEIHVLRADFAENDRAQADASTKGFLKAIVGKRGKILGATIVGAHASELVLPWVLAISKGLKIGDLASVVVPYPTLSEISKRAAGSYFTPLLFSSRTRRLVRFLAAFG